MVLDIRSVTLATIVDQYPGWIPVLEEFGIDGRNGLAITLAAASDRVDADINAVVAALSGPPLNRWDCRTVGAAPIRSLIEHIETVHHSFLRNEFPRINQLIAAARLERPNDALLSAINEHFDELRGDMEPHILSEGRMLFPMCKSIVDAFSWPSFHSGPVAHPIDLLKHDHDHAGELLTALVSLVDDFDQLRGALEDEDDIAELVAAVLGLNADLRQHLSEENDLLFPKTLRLAGELNGL